MKLVKYPARTIIMKIFCDCGKGEMEYHSTSKEGFIHRCNNPNCKKEAVFTQQFPSTAAEIVNILVEDLNPPKEEEVSEELNVSEDSASAKE